MSAEVATETAGGILGTLGIDWRIFIAQLVNFGIVLLVLWRFLWRPLLRALDERKKMIERSIEDAHKIEASLAELEQTKKTIIAEARTKGEQALAETLVSAERVREESVAQTKLDIDRLLKQGRQELERERRNMVAEAKEELADLVVQVAEKAVQETMTEKRQRDIVSRIIAQL